MKILATTILGLALFVMPLTTKAGTYTEDFRTTSLRDSTASTADWNTGSGELKMFPFAPDLLGSYSTPGSALAVVVTGQRAFVADHAAGLQIFDISNPAFLALVGTYNTPGLALDVVVQGHMAFIADYTLGLQIVDVSNPAAPVLVGTYNTTDTARGVAVAGNRAYIADGAGGLQIIDISNLAAPTLLGTYNTPGLAYDVTIDGQRAYVADGSGLQIIDIATPASPLLLGTFNTTGTAYGVSISGQRAYIAGGLGGLQIIDVANAASPSLVGTYLSLGTARSVAVAGDRAYLADEANGLVIVDISNPYMPTPLNTFNSGGASARGIATSGDRAYIADFSAGLQVVRISHLANPEVLGTYNGIPNITKIATAGDRAYLFNSAGLHIMNIANPSSPSQMGLFSVNMPTDLALSGDYAFIAANGGNMRIVDISNPANPVQVSVYSPPNLAHFVAVSGNLAYVANDRGTSGDLIIVDISHPILPHQLGSTPISSVIRSLAVSGNQAYVLTSGNVQIVDVSDPVNPTPGANISPRLVGAYFVSMTVSGTLVYLLDSNIELLIVDVSDPASPAALGHYTVGGSSTSITMSVFGDYLYVTDGGEIEVVDISDPTRPQAARRYLLGGGSGPFFLTGQRAYRSNFYDLEILRIAQDEFDASRPMGQSLPLNPLDPHAIYSVRLSAVAADSTGWEVSNNGWYFQAVTPGIWTPLPFTGTDLSWRSTLAWTASGVNPSVASVTVDWLNPFAIISAVSDLPNDQGKQVRVSWNPCGHDIAGDPTPITEYAIYRQIDPRLPKALTPAANAVLAGLSPIARQHAKSMQAAGWDFLATVPALTADAYAVVAPTVVDSTISNGLYSTTFYVAALTATPGVFYSSPPDSGYSRDNLAPGLPLGILASYVPGSGTMIDWQDAPEPDFQYYSVYRSITPGFIPSAGSLIQQTTASTWTDPLLGAQYFYKITATDYSGNESQAGATGIVSGVADQDIPRQTNLRLAVPNPFNPLTTLSFDLAVAGPVQLKVYDAAGRLVVTLIDETRAAGHHEAIWNGRDDAGHMAAAGVYLYRLNAGAYIETRRMTLVK